MKFGMIPSPPDERDFTFDKVVAYSATQITDIRARYIPPFIDQLNIGCCVAVSAAKILGCIEWSQRGVYIPLSVAHAFGLRLETDFQGDGMIPRQAGLNYTRWGIVPWEKLPGIMSFEQARDSITSVLDGDGLPNRPYALVRLRTLQEMFDYMSLYGFPLWFGFNVYSNIGTGRVIPAPSGTFLGSHMVAATGLKASGKLELQHSWTGYGDDNHESEITLSEHSGWECWGFIPESSDLLYKRQKEVLLTIGSNTMWVDDKSVTIPVHPFITQPGMVSPPGKAIPSGSAVVPLRAIAEAYGSDVKFTSVPGGGYILLKNGGVVE